ncbi:GntR family transcriptional regulator [Nonomuraea sp. NPDC049152]|uniref:GntR family transcriptional regulator n=1 Tax=Nonomuraea sp. NPDC049152 TaxID=3154350 RepID=UPI0033EB9F48
MRIERRPLREQIKGELLRRLERGEFDPEESLNEGQIAASMGVSRTPLREALIALEIEGVIRSEQGRGFRFAPLSPKEFSELAQVLSGLEALALRLSDPADLGRIAPALLEKARDFPTLGAEDGVTERYDDEWHDLLLGCCPNERLIELIASLKLGMRRYARLVVSDVDVLERMAEEHERIAEHLLRGDVAGAVASLCANWDSGAERVLERLPYVTLRDGGRYGPRT